MSLRLSLFLKTLTVFKSMFRYFGLSDISLMVRLGLWTGDRGEGTTGVKCQAHPAISKVQMVDISYCNRVQSMFPENRKTTPTILDCGKGRVNGTEFKIHCVTRQANSMPS